jgi:hypothetical protein
MRFGKGRVAVFGEATMFSAQVATIDNQSFRTDRPTNLHTAIPSCGGSERVSAISPLVAADVARR